MPLTIIRQDITRLAVDAIVNAANSSLLGGGGVDGAIHRAAGPQLMEECRALHGCMPGEAKITQGYHLPCKYVIHTVGPVWQGGRHGEEALLTACYRHSMELARAHGCETIAFPLISSGVFGYPKAQALKVAVDTITQFLLENDMTVYLVVFSRDAFEISSKLFSAVKAYIDDVYVDHQPDSRLAARRMEQETEDSCFHMEQTAYDAEMDACCSYSIASDTALEDMLNQIDESFSQMLLRKIDEKHLTDAECYKRANVDRRLFNKIKNNPSYRPGKQTVLAFAIALGLSLEETKDMLMKAGFALSHSSKSDIVVEYCIMTGNYDIFEINQILFKLDLVPLGY